MEYKKKINRWTAARLWRGTALFFVLAVHAGVEECSAQEVDYSQKCCELGNNWAKRTLRCEKFIGPIPGVPQSDQSLCLKIVDVCCKNIYREMSCEEGKSDARLGKDCNTSQRRTTIDMENYRRDCCEGCKLGIFTGSQGKKCTPKNFGSPWDTTFLECCNELKTTTHGNTPTSQLTVSDVYTLKNSDNVGTTPSIQAGYRSGNTGTASGPYSQITGTPTTDKGSRQTPSGFNSRRSSSTSSNFPTPTPALDDICELMKGQLCSEICVPTAGSYYCKCKDGSTLLEDGKTCRPNVKASSLTTQNIQKYVTPSVRSAPNNARSTLSDDSNSRCPTGYRYNDQQQVCDEIGERKCINSAGSYTCYGDDDQKSQSCPLGYLWEPYVSRCIDVNECTEVPPPCNIENHVCINIDGSYTCHELRGVGDCPPGFQFNSTLNKCIDVDECTEKLHSCRPTVEICKNLEGSFRCDIKCESGYTYNDYYGICEDVDECLEEVYTCPPTEPVCVNTDGSYTCSSVLRIPQLCPNGYKSSGSGDTCVDIDECEERLHRCNEQSEECINEIGSFRCESLYIDQDWNGDEYQHQQKGGANFGTRDANGGRSDRHEEDFYNFGRKYTDAEDAVNTIVCPLGFEFVFAVNKCADIDECKDHVSPCSTGENCRNTIGGYDCIPPCSHGFHFVNDTCQDVDECELGLHTCSSTQRCQNTNGSFTCEIVHLRTTTYEPPKPTCEKGYKYDLSYDQCVDIDECVEGPGCRDHEKCRNLQGNYDCSPLCGAGWFFDPSTKSCQDVDECLLGRHNCRQRTHYCRNTNGTYVCELRPKCASGYRRGQVGNCVDIDECAENLHSCAREHHRYCINRDGTFECVTRLPACSPGFEYSLLTQQCEDIDECRKGKFQCDDRFYERCVNLIGSYKCERPASDVRSTPRKRPACPAGYRYNVTDRKCADIDECKEGIHMCENEICYNLPGSYQCAKAPLPITRKSSSSTTVAASTNNNTNCDTGYSLDTSGKCVDVNECTQTEGPCSSLETCVNLAGSYACNCRKGFRRDELTQACIDINECQMDNDCLATQRCDNTIGSYNCVRYLPCGTGYTLNAATEICEDDNECVLGTHDCSNGYQCRNTYGSYRCDRIRTSSKSTTTTARSTDITNLPGTTKLSIIVRPTSRSAPLTSPPSRNSSATNRPRSCPRGFESSSSGQCVDIDECRRTPSPCARSQRCVNTIGSYNCKSNLCNAGSVLNPSTGRCMDMDECTDGTHECGVGQTCQNRPGGYTCICPEGHEINAKRECVDIDECKLLSSSRLCGAHATCENTVGSYRCICGEGFENDASGVCQDINECTKIPGLCQQDCFNTWGSYKCACKFGYRIHADNRTCVDVDECEEYKDRNLCVGICDNTPGSYSCRCPDGYKLAEDARTCQDIDECSIGRVCRAPNEMCLNTRGSYRCNKIDCPRGYVLDSKRKNRCVRKPDHVCPRGDQACIHAPSHYSYSYLTLQSLYPIPPTTGQVELFAMHSTHTYPDATMEFNLKLIRARAPSRVTPADESCFAVRKPFPFQASLVLTKPIAGPQDIELEMSMEVYLPNGAFAGSAIAKIFIIVSAYNY